jgi:hypothetical protein
MKFLPKNYLPKVWDFCGECGSVGQGWPKAGRLTTRRPDETNKNSWQVFSAEKASG